MKGYKGCKMKTLFILITLLAVILLTLTSCQYDNSQAGTPAPEVFPQPITSPPPPKTDWEKGSPPPAGIGGWQQPKPLSEDDISKVINIAVSSQQASEWLQGRSDYRTSPITWYAIIWNNGEATTWWSLEYERVATEGIPDFVSPYALWYPGVTIAVGEGAIYQMQIAVDLDPGKTAMVTGPYPSLSSPDRFRPSMPSVPAPEPSVTPATSKEQAIETASRTLPTSIVERADISAEMHGWYWEVIFDNLNAEADELTPWPLKGPPSPAPGQPASDPYPGIWQMVVITVDIQTGDIKSAGARRAPRPGPYVSQSQAIQSAKEFTSRVPDWLWIDRAKVEAYLLGDTWIVLFWEEGPTENRVKASVDAVTGAATGGGRG